jgi:uncharacterized membrane protein YcaP (DUF421 family)
VIGHDLMTVGVPLVEKVVRTVAVYGGLAVLLRLAGKREMAQLNTFDLVVVLLLSNVVQNAVIGPDNSLVGGLLGATVLVAVDATLVRLAIRSDRISRLFEGTPTVLVRQGRVVDHALRRIGVRRSQVEAAVRRQNAESLDDVDEATLEPGGVVVVQLTEAARGTTAADLDALYERIDGLERALTERLDALLAQST